MARTTLAVQSRTVTQDCKTLADVTMNNSDQANGNEFTNDGKTELHVLNGDGSARTLTVSGVADENGRTQDLAIAISAGKTARIGPFRPRGYNQTDGKVYLSWSVGTTTAVKIGVVSDP
jgi:hypothetical protein